MTIFLAWFNAFMGALWPPDSLASTVILAELEYRP